MAKTKTRAEKVKLAVECMIQQSEVACRVPQEVLKPLENLAFSKDKEPPSMDQIWRDANLSRRFRVTLRQWREYMLLLQTLRLGLTCSQVADALELMMRLPVDKREQVQDAGNMLLFGRLAKMVERPKLTPEQLAHLADALARANTAIARTDAERLAKLKFARTRRDAQRDRRKKESQQDIDLAEQVRRIYGVEVPWGQKKSETAREIQEEIAKTQAADSKAGTPGV